MKPLPHISPVGSVFQSRSRRDRPPSRKGPALPVKSLLEFTATRHIDSPSGTQRANILGIECGLFTPHGRSRYHLESCTRAGACLTLHPVTNKPRRGSPSAKIPRTSRCCAHHLDQSLNLVGLGKSRRNQNCGIYEASYALLDLFHDTSHSTMFDPNHLIFFRVLEIQ